MKKQIFKSQCGNTFWKNEKNYEQNGFPLHEEDGSLGEVSRAVGARRLTRSTGTRSTGYEQNGIHKLPTKIDHTIRMLLDWADANINLLIIKKEIFICMTLGAMCQKTKFRDFKCSAFKMSLNQNLHIQARLKRVHLNFQVWVELIWIHLFYWKNL